MRPAAVLLKVSQVAAVEGLAHAPADGAAVELQLLGECVLADALLVVGLQALDRLDGLAVSGLTVRPTPSEIRSATSSRTTA